MISMSLNLTTTPGDEGDDDICVDIMQALQKVRNFLRPKTDKEKSSSSELDTYSPKKEATKISKSDKKLLMDSTTSDSKHCKGNCSSSKALSGSSRKGKELVQFSEVEKLNERLKAVEEETKMMKQELYETLKERRRVVSELYQQLLVIHQCIHLGNQSIISPWQWQEEERDDCGLLQVLTPDSDSCVLHK